MYETAVGPAAVHSHPERVGDEFCAHVVGHLPANDPAAVGVLNGRQVQPPFPGSQVGDVGKPQHVRLDGFEPPLHEVISDANAGHPDRCAPAFLGDKP
jgi:hypothetical protein